MIVDTLEVYCKMKFSKVKTTKNERDSHPLLVTMSTRIESVEGNFLVALLINILREKFMTYA